jgi:hypothetical protein
MAHIFSGFTDLLYHGAIWVFGENPNQFCPMGICIINRSDIITFDKTRKRGGHCL